MKSSTRGCGEAWTGIFFEDVSLHHIVLRMGSLSLGDDPLNLGGTGITSCIVWTLNCYLEGSSLRCEERGQQEENVADHKLRPSAKVTVVELTESQHVLVQEHISFQDK